MHEIKQKFNQVKTSSYNNVSLARDFSSEEINSILFELH